MFSQVELHAVAVFFFRCNCPDGHALVGKMNLVGVVDERGVERGKRSSNDGSLSFKVDCTLIGCEVFDCLVFFVTKFWNVSFEFFSQEVLLGGSSPVIK